MTARNRRPIEKSERLRSEPAQQRSRATFERILSAAAALLDEVGWEGFNTNLLAEGAGCRVSAIYRYFPDKIAVASVLAERAAAAWSAPLHAFVEEIDRRRDLHDVWRAYLPQFVSVVRATPGALAIRKAMRVVPELQAIDDEDNARLAALIGAALAKRLPHIAAQRAEAAAWTLIQSGAALLDHAHRAPKEQTDALMQEFSAMHEAYLARLEQSAATQKDANDA